MSLPSGGLDQTSDAEPINGLDTLFNFLVQSSAPEPVRSNTRPSKRGKKRKKTKNGAYLDDITKEEILSLTHLPTAQAAKELKVGTTSFKRVCRLHGIHTWPYKSHADPRVGPSQVGYMAQESAQPVPAPVYNTFTRFLTPHYLSYAAPVPDETLRLIEIVSDDIKRVSDLHIPLNYAADTPSIESLLKTVKLSQTMRRTSGISIFNDGVLLKLMERLSMANAGKYRTGSQQPL